jgi:DNA integrity scanning protein DisA with diadenylate cyclase activity
VQLGLGSRHVAAAAVSRLLHIFVVVLSQSRVTRVFFDGQIVWTSCDGSRPPVSPARSRR